MHRPTLVHSASAGIVQAMRQWAVEAAVEECVNIMAESSEIRTCRACGGRNRPENRFCALCGVPLDEGPPEETEVQPAKSNSPALPGGQHHYHHHYHHHYFSSADGISPAAGPDSHAGNVVAPARDTRVRSPLGAPALSRAEAAVRKLTQDWVLACNAKQLDDLAGLYLSDALVLRANVPAVRGTAAIREFFFGVLDAGLGDVELEPLRVEVFGEVAYDAGRYKMLVPVAMGKRREERGKYLLIANRQAGEWKIAADCWSSDLSLGVSVEPAAKPSVPGPGSTLPRLPRKV